jgi:D-threo-aldose 1-dehydrogenase
VSRVSRVRQPDLSRIGLGCASLGNLYQAMGDDDATAVVDAAWDAGIRYFDTAPLYGHGLSEQRLGRALARRPRDTFVVSTKVGRLLRPTDVPIETIFDLPDSSRALAPVFDFSADGVRRSLEESLARLGLDRVDVVFVHDPDDHQDEALAGAFPALLALRDEGVIGAVGAGMNQWEALDRFVRSVDLDVVLLAGRYTLLDRSASDVLLPRCLERGVAVVLGGVFGTGVLADPVAHATFDYAPVPPAVARLVDAMQRVCENHDTPLGAAALQHALRHAAVTSVVVGAHTAGEIVEDLRWAELPIPDALWSELEEVVPSA